MAVHKVCNEVVLDVTPDRVRFFTTAGTFSVSTSDALRMARSMILCIEDDLEQTHADESASEVQVLETIVPEPALVVPQITDAVTAPEPEKKKRGRPKKAIDAVVVDTLAQMPDRGAEPDVKVALDGQTIMAEKVAEIEGEAVVVHMTSERSGSVIVVESERIEELEPYSENLQEALVQRFPVGHRARVWEDGVAHDGVVTRHYEGTHKCQVDTAGGAKIVDMRKIADAPAHDPDPEVIEKLKGGTYGVDYGQRWLGAPMLKANDVILAAAWLGVPEQEARLTLGAVITGNGLINTQVAATSVAMWFNSNRQKPEPAPDAPVDPMLTPEELNQVRAEVKAAGVTAAQAKDLCMRHFKKDSAALLTQSEMQKFLGEVLPTWVEMQGAEDF